MLDMLFIFILKKIHFMKHTVYKIKLHIEIQPTRNKYTTQAYFNNLLSYGIQIG